MPLPVALFVVLLALNLGSGRGDDSTNEPVEEPTEEHGDSRQTPNILEQIGKDCPCTTPLTCMNGKCDCDKPTDMKDCSCDLGSGHTYRRWEKDVKDNGECKLAYGESPCKTGGEKYEMCGPGLKCDKYCKISATSVPSPFSVGALVISALIMMILK